LSTRPSMQCPPGRTYLLQAHPENVSAARAQEEEEGEDEALAPCICIAPVICGECQHALSLQLASLDVCVECGAAPKPSTLDPT